MVPLLLPNELHAEEWIGSWYASRTTIMQVAESVVASAVPLKRTCASEEALCLIPADLVNATMCTVVHLTSGGNHIRLHMSNEFGEGGLAIGGIWAGPVAGGVKSPVSFNGDSSTVIPPGKSLVSDPLAMAVLPDDDIEIRMFFPGRLLSSPTLTFGAEKNVILPGDRLSAIGFSNVSPTPTTYSLTAVDVRKDRSTAAIVAVGDSITAGGSQSWPALLARRLLGHGKAYSVLNAGIAGSRLLRDAPPGELYGASVLNRQRRDVLDQTGVRYVILHVGINDIGLPQTRWDKAASPVESAELIDGLIRFTERAHRRGLAVYLATIVSFKGHSEYYSDQKDKVRNEVNAWIRSSTIFDGCFDFDHALSDPLRPEFLCEEFDSGDGLHPNTEGQRALSEAIDLAAFE